MKIDQDYLKKLLEACQATKKPTFDIKDLKAAGFDYNDPQFEFHMRILTDQGFIERDDGEPGFGLTKSIDGYLSWAALPLRLIHPKGLENSELKALMHRHELALGPSPMRIFLSHKGSNKPVVRELARTLTLLGFDPWLDEDAMPAGAQLEREILKGFADSCAAVFFITPEFKDEAYLATEVDYAIRQKRTKGDRFSIITLVYVEGAAKGKVPDLLRSYVWKEPKSQFEALQEIIRALPIKVGSVSWR